MHFCFKNHNIRALLSRKIITYAHFGRENRNVRAFWLREKNINVLQGIAVYSIASNVIAWRCVIFDVIAHIELLDIL